MIAIHAQTERKRLDRSVRCAENAAPGKETAASRSDPSRSSSLRATAGAACGRKSLFSARYRLSSPQTTRHLGNAGYRGWQRNEHKGNNCGGPFTAGCPIRRSRHGSRIAEGDRPCRWRRSIDSVCPARCRRPHWKLDGIRLVGPVALRRNAQWRTGWMRNCATDGRRSIQPSGTYRGFGLLNRFLQTPGARRSAHPDASMVAVGPLAGTPDAASRTSGQADWIAAGAFLSSVPERFCCSEPRRFRYRPALRRGHCPHPEQATRELRKCRSAARTAGEMETRRGFRLQRHSRLFRYRRRADAVETITNAYVELRRHREGLVGQAHCCTCSKRGISFPVRCRPSSTALCLALIRRMACGDARPHPINDYIRGAPRRKYGAPRHCEQKRLTSRGLYVRYRKPCLPSRSSMEPKPPLHPVI